MNLLSRQVEYKQLHCMCAWSLAKPSQWGYMYVILIDGRAIYHRQRDLVNTYIHPRWRCGGITPRPAVWIQGAFSLFLVYSKAGVTSYELWGSFSLIKVKIKGWDCSGWVFFDNFAFRFSSYMSRDSQILDPEILSFVLWPLMIYGPLMVRGKGRWLGR